MLLSLISVLVLLVIAFYAVWVGVMGRVNGNEGPELSIPGRALVIGIALVAFGAAYLVYSHPRQEAVVTAEAPAMPSNPPESRGSAVAAAEPVAEAPGAAERETPAAAPSEPIAEAPATVANAPEPAPAASSDEDGEGLSAGAALFEADRSQPRREPVKATAAAIAEKMGVERMPVEKPVEHGSATVDIPPARSARYSASSVSTSRPRGARGRLILHVQNALGRDQQREQLTLSIEGKAVADIEVDSSSPTVAVAVPLPRPGLLHYRLEGVSESDGSTRLVGEGCIRVRDGARFAVRRKDGSRKVFLEAARVAG